LELALDSFSLIVLYDFSHSASHDVLMHLIFIWLIDCKACVTIHPLLIGESITILKRKISSNYAMATLVEEPLSLPLLATSAKEKVA